MSFSSSALTNTKARLRPTVTRVTRPDGKIVLEREGESEETSQSAPGFVVDTKPDLSVSQVSLSHDFPQKSILSWETDASQTNMKSEIF